MLFMTAEHPPVGVNALTLDDLVLPVNALQSIPVFFRHFAPFSSSDSHFFCGKGGQKKWDENTARREARSPAGRIPSLKSGVKKYFRAPASSYGTQGSAQRNFLTVEMVALWGFGTSLEWREPHCKPFRRAEGHAHCVFGVFAGRGRAQPRACPVTLKRRTLRLLGRPTYERAHALMRVRLHAAKHQALHDGKGQAHSGPLTPIGVENRRASPIYVGGGRRPLLNCQGVVADANILVFAFPFTV